METQPMFVSEFRPRSRLSRMKRDLGRRLGRWLFGRFRKHSDFFQAGPMSNVSIVGVTISATEGTIHPGVVYRNDEAVPVSEIFEAGRARGIWERRPIWRKALDAAVTRWG